MGLGNDNGQPVNHIGFNQIFRMLGGGNQNPMPTLAVGSGANVTVSKAFPTITGSHLSPGQIIASYDVAGAGKLQVLNAAGTLLMSVDLTAAGAAPFDLDAFLLPISTGMTVRLTAVAGAIGSLNLGPHAKKA